MWQPNSTSRNDLPEWARRLGVARIRIGCRACGHERKGYAAALPDLVTMGVMLAASYEEISTDGGETWFTPRFRYNEAMKEARRGPPWRRRFQ